MHHSLLLGASCGRGDMSLQSVPYLGAAAAPWKCRCAGLACLGSGAPAPAAALWHAAPASLGLTALFCCFLQKLLELYHGTNQTVKQKTRTHEADWGAVPLSTVHSRKSEWGWGLEYRMPELISERYLTRIPNRKLKKKKRFTKFYMWHSNPKQNKIKLSDKHRLQTHQ